MKWTQRNRHVTQLAEKYIFSFLDRTHTHTHTQRTTLSDNHRVILLTFYLSNSCPVFACSISLALSPSPVVQRLHSHDSALTFSIDFHKSFGGRWLRLSRRHACLFWDFLFVAALETRSGLQRGTVSLWNIISLIIQFNYLNDSLACFILLFRGENRVSAVAVKFRSKWIRSGCFFLFKSHFITNVCYKKYFIYDLCFYPEVL